MDVRLINGDGVEERSADELGELLSGGDGLVWVDIPSCDARGAQVLADVFGFHPMAIHDCVERNRVAKMHAYPDHVFVVLHTPERGARGHVHYVELDQFVGRNYLVTVHGPLNPAVRPDAALRETDSVLRRMRGRPAAPDDALGALARDRLRVTRSQEAFVESVTSDVWQLEQRVTGGDVGDPVEFLNELFRARHGLLAVRTMGALGAASYERMASLTGVSPGGHGWRPTWATS